MTIHSFSQSSVSQSAFCFITEPHNSHGYAEFSVDRAGHLLPRGEYARAILSIFLIRIHTPGGSLKECQQCHPVWWEEVSGGQCSPSEVRGGQGNLIPKKDQEKTGVAGLLPWATFVLTWIVL